MAEPATRLIPMDHIRMDGAAQCRAEVCEETVAEYAAAFAAGAVLPPVEVLVDGKDYYPWDGFHRILAAHRAGLKAVRCNVSKGTREEARWLSCGANKIHGKKRTNEDKQCAVKMALTLQPELSDRAIGDHCGVDHKTVAVVRSSLGNFPSQPDDTSTKPTHRIGRDGRTIDTSNIGKKRGKTRKSDEEPTLSEAEQQAAGEALIAAAAEGRLPEVMGVLPPVVDDDGIPVQEHAAAAFAPDVLDEFDRLAGLLREVQKSMTALADGPGGAALAQLCQWSRSQSKAGGRWVLAALDNAIKLFESAKPAHTDCPYAFNEHHPHDENCVLCKGRRWTGSLKGHQIPPVCTQAMLRHYGVEE